MTITQDAAGNQPDKVVAMIASPLEPDLAARIGAAYPARVDLIYRPDLMPPSQYPADHGGDPHWQASLPRQAEWLELLRRAEILFDFPVRVDGNPLDHAPNLRWLQATSAGVGPKVKRVGLQESDVIITTASGVHAQPLAEFVFAALLFHAKRLAHVQAEQRAHHWERFAARELRGQTMAVIAPGRIGQEIARLARCFGMTVWAMARRHDPARAAQLGIDRLFARDELKEMLAGADCLALCVPHTPETEGLLDREHLAALKPGAVLVNIARGAVIDEAALIEALRSGQIGLAALDVFATEPLPADSPLWDLPNVWVSPHSASTADTENGKLADLFIRNLGHYLAGEFDQMSPVLDKERLY